MIEVMFSIKSPLSYAHDFPCRFRLWFSLAVETYLIPKTQIRQAESSSVNLPPIFWKAYTGFGYQASHEINDNFMPQCNDEGTCV